MRIHNGTRGSGKTTEMLIWLQSAPPDEFRVVVAYNRAEARRLFDEFHRGKVWESPDERREAMRHFTSIREVAQGKYAGRTNVVFGIDELEISLLELFRHPVEFVTVNEAGLIDLRPHPQRP